MIFINSHPIQYFAPLYKYLNQQGVSTSAWYCTDKTIKGEVDKEFGVPVKWDIPLLEGYKYRFFKNHALKPSHENGYFGLLNLGLIKSLFTIPKSIIIVHGWHYLTHSLVLLLAPLRGHTVCLRYEMPYNQEVLKSGWKQKAKKFFLKNILFSQVKHFLFIGTQNRNLYKLVYNVPDAKLIFCPYSVDNTRFTLEYHNQRNNISIIKQRIGIPVQDKVVLFSGKYIDKKRPMDALMAFKHLALHNVWLIMLGEGELRPTMEAYIKEQKLKNVILTGFVNQTQVADYYSISNAFVMCSTVGETWGLSVNEALNFKLPVIISDLTGCSADLVIPGQNGYTFKTGDYIDLSEKLSKVLTDTTLPKQTISESLLSKYSYSTISTNLKTLSVSPL